MAALSYQSLSGALALEDVSVLARRIEAREPVSDAAIAGGATRLASLPNIGGCEERHHRASVTIALATLDRRNAALDFDGWSQALAEAQRALRVSLACTPTSGSLWALLALTERSAAAAPERIAAALLASERLAPLEEAVLANRAELWRTSPWLDGEAAALRDRDIARILAHAYPPDAARMLRDPPPVVEGRIRALLADQPERRARLLRQGGVLAETVPGSSAPAGATRAFLPLRR